MTSCTSPHLFTPSSSSFAEDAVRTLKPDHEDVDTELSALMENPRVCTSVTRVKGTHCWYFSGSKLSNFHTLGYARSLMLREKLKSRYYVFNHAQVFRTSIINIVAKKLMEIFEQKTFKDFEVLRHDVFLEQIDEKTHTVEWFQKRIRGAHEEDDHVHRTALISADIYLEHIVKLESALSFFSEGHVVGVGIDDRLNLLSQLTGRYCSNQETAKDLSKDLLYVVDKLLTSVPPEATLYSICVPKEKFQEIGYLSLRLGRPLELPFTPEHMELLQNGERADLLPEFSPDPERFARGYMDTEIPQVRLLAHKLKPENGVLIIPHYSFSNAKLQMVESKIDELIKERFSKCPTI